jgi:hypothetical protein
MSLVASLMLTHSKQPTLAQDTDRRPGVGAAGFFDQILLQLFESGAISYRSDDSV